LSDVSEATEDQILRKGEAALPGGGKSS
jgi:hypothetical protein